MANLLTGPGPSDTTTTIVTKGGFKSEGRGGFSQLPKMSAEKTYLGFRK